MDNTINTRSGLTITKGALSARIYAEGQLDVVAKIIKATFGRRGSFKNYVWQRDFFFSFIPKNISRYFIAFIPMVALIHKIILLWLYWDDIINDSMIMTHSTLQVQ